MATSATIKNSVEQLGYRVTVGDVAAQAGLEINVTQQELLALASDVGGHMQVAETGDIVYLFPKNFRSILRNKYWRIQLQEWWQKVWKVLFFLIRISFGIILMLSILLMVVAITVIFIAISSSSDGDNDSGGSNIGGGFNFWISPDIFWLFHWNSYSDYPDHRRQNASNNENNNMHFLEAVFSFLFGDGNPNYDLEERRWQEIGGVIRQYNGAIVAEQVAPYLDNVNRDNEDYIIPVLARFNGYPQVSEEGEIVYFFPELQITASNHRQPQLLTSYFREHLWRFSQAGSGQIMLACGLGALNFVLALVLGSLLQGEVSAQIGGLVAFADSIYWLLLSYGTAFLTIPLVRYFWIQWQNSRISARNSSRQTSAAKLNQGDEKLHRKIAFANQFAAQKVINQEDITYSTETDLLEQNLQQADKIDQEWQKRLESDS